ncbi:MAG: hypothetical protein AAF502_17780 [Bacteroidota bacterium]
MKKNLENLFADASGLDKRSAGYIIQALEKANLDGFDYLEFKMSLTKMTHLAMDESMRYQSAFAAASAIGLTREKLLETAAFYKKVVSKEKNQFDAAMEEKIKNEVAGKKAEVVKLEKAIADREAQIEKLKEEIEKFKGKIGKRKEDLSGIQGKIDQAKDSFVKAHDTILNYIDTDIRKIEQFIN